MDAFNYLLLVNIYLVLFYGFYSLFLKNETFFKLNRIYLVGGASISFLIPFLQSEWIRSLFITKQVEEVTQTFSMNLSGETVIMPARNQGLETGEILLLIYFAGVVICLLRFLWQLYKLKSILNSPENGQAFSFFSKVKVGSDILNRDTIYGHELVHAGHWHSADVILFEIICIINWFNPVVYFYRKAIKHIHEFTADEIASRQEESRSAYALLLLSQTFGIPTHQLTNSFYNQSLLKRRIIMLHKLKSDRIAIFKYGLSAPLFAGMLIFSSACGKPEIEEKAFKSSDRIVEVSSERIDLPKSQKVHVQPEFPGGISSFTKFISANYKNPPQAVNNKLAGEIITSFVIDEKGILTNIQIIKGLGYGTSEEVIRILEASPKWKPGLQNGKPVNISYTMPIKIDLLKAGQERVEIDALISEREL